MTKTVLNLLWNKISKNFSTKKLVIDALANKQDLIIDIETIRSNSLSAYLKPSTGIPAGDLASGVIPTNVSSFTNDSKYVTEDDMQVTIVDANGHEYVDLGLPSGTLWATMNVGASSETDYGNYYQYGKGAAQYAATSGDSNYGGTEDPLDSSVDTAVQVWGGDWHMPTYTQFEELIVNTTYQWVTNYKGSGINGGTFTATNGAVLFIPAAGFWLNGSQYEVGNCGYYWSSSPSGSSSAYILYFEDGDKGVYGYDRKRGYSVRGVINASKAPKYATKAELTSTESTLNTADTTTNTRITNLTGQSGSTYTARTVANDGASFIKNANNIQEALNNLDDALLALTSLLTLNGIVPLQPGNPLYYRDLTIDNNGTPLTHRCVVDSNGDLLTDNNGYIFRSNANPETWVFQSSEYTAQLIAAAGGARTVTFNAAGELVTFTVDDVECDIYNNQVTPTPQEWVNPRNEAILYAKEYVSGSYVLADNFGRGLRFETHQGSYNFIELEKKGDDWDFSQTVSSIGPAPSVDIESEWTDGYTKAEFTLGGTSYNVDTMKFENPAWITPNNIVEYI